MLSETLIDSYVVSNSVIMRTGRRPGQVAGVVGVASHTPQAAGLIPGWGAYGRQLVRFLTLTFLSFSSFFSLESIQTYPRVRINRKKKDKETIIIIAPIFK